MLRTPLQRSAHTLTLVLAGLLLMTLAGPAFAASGDGKSWGAFFGRTHVLILHLPIGLLVGAFIIEFFGLFKRSKGYDVAAAWLFVLGFISAVGAVVTGMLLGVEAAGHPDLTVINLLFADADKGVTDTMGLHMWLGVTMMVIAGVAAVLKVKAVRKQWPDEVATPDHGGWSLVLARFSLIGVMAAMPVVGHLGGNMTHGSKFLTERAPDSALGRTVVSAIDIMNFGTVKKTAQTPGKTGEDGVEYKPDGSVAAWNGFIQPVLDDSCVRCHGPSKKNGGIRVDSLAETLKSKNENGLLEYPLLTPRDAQFSALHTVVVLPQSHDLFMPPDEKDLVSLEAAAFIGEWIQNYDGRLEDPDAPKPEAGDNDEGSGDGNGGTTAAKPLIDPAAVRAIEDAGGSAQSLSQEESPELLTVKFAYLKTLDPEAVAKLGNTANQVAWLTFEGSAFNDSAADQMPELPKLTKLNLKDTPITDAGLDALPDLPKLEWLNLFGTPVTDAGLDALKRYTGLKKLYLTGTGVTAEGVAELREALQGTEVYSDFDGQFSFGTDESEPAADAMPVNTVCPVSGAPVKDGFVSTFEGKTVGFCCNNCKAAFDKEPAKFKDKIKPAEPQSAKPVNDKCPVTGAPINAGQFVIYKDKKVAFCCGNCKAKFEENPEPFAAKIP